MKQTKIASERRLLISQRVQARAWPSQVTRTRCYPGVRAMNIDELLCCIKPRIDTQNAFGKFASLPALLKGLLHDGWICECMADQPCGDENGNLHIGLDRRESKGLSLRSKSA
jgi:hypothetical protein